MFKNNTILALIILTALALFGCKSDKKSIEKSIQLNPYKNAPLSALLKITPEKACKLTYAVKGQSPIIKTVNLIGGENEIPIIGLYPDKNNTVLLRLEDGKTTIVDSIQVQAAAIPVEFPRIEVSYADRVNMEKGLHLIDLHFAQNGKYHSRPVIFDDEGIIRWYLDLSFFGNILYPISRTSEGDFLVGGMNSIYEFDILGKVKNHIELDKKYKVHHEVIEIPGNKILAAITKGEETIIANGKEISSLMDHIALIDRSTNQIVKEWDLRKHLDVDRDDLNTMLPKEDWLHMNGMAFDKRDSCIYISSKNQGLIKLGWDDELKWILSQNVSWGKAGRDGQGKETKDYLLTAVDQDGKPYPTNVQQGKISPDNFDLPWGMHAPDILPNGNVILFDNGFLRNFAQGVSYSRGVEYKIDDENKTVSQVWEYGKKEGKKLFSMLLSDVDHLPNKNNRLVTFGFINHYGKIIEVDYPSNRVLFQATIHYKTMNGNKTFNWGQLDMVYRSERIVL